MARLCVEIFFALALFGWATAQKYAWGSCPTQAAQKNFNFLAYNGRWYEQLKYNNDLQFGFKCDTRDYSPGSNGFINLLHKRFDVIGRSEFDIYGTMVTYEEPSVGKFYARYRAFPIWDMPLRYWVLETDYSSYSINWSCRDIPGVIHRQYLWVYTRDRSPSEDFLSIMRYKIGFRGLDSGPIVRTIQDCGNFNQVG